MTRLHQSEGIFAAAVSLLVGVLSLSPVAMAQQLAEPVPQWRFSPSKPPTPQHKSGAMLACPQFGPGFGRAPGSSACVKLDGFVRGETRFRARSSSLDGSSGFNTQARLSLDIRTPTDFGTARIVVQGGRPGNTSFPTSGR